MIEHCREYKITTKSVKSKIEAEKITSSKDSYRVIRKFYHEDINLYESFFILLLNQRNHTIGFAKISQGGVCGTVACPRLIAKIVVDTLATGVVIAHNHPSGNLKPSMQDNEVTKKIKEGLKLFDVRLLDHLIVTDSEYYSFADECDL